MVIVHGFETWDGARMVWSKYKLTDEELAHDRSLVKIPGTGEAVPIGALDGKGRYYPAA